MAINIRTDKNYRSESTCTFCQEQGHTITGCSEIIKEANLGRELTFSERSYKQHYAMQYIDLKTSRSTKRKTSTRKCGYCGGTGHNRRDCVSMKADKDLLIKANKVWRRLYAQISVEMGFAPASLIKYRERDTYNYNTGKYETKEGLYLIGSELPSNLSVFAIAGDYNLRQDIKIPAVGRDRSMSLRDFIGNSGCRNALSGNGYWWGNDQEHIEIITKSTYQFTEEWINGDCDDILFVLKKWNKDRIERDILKQIRENLVPYAQSVGLWD